MRNFAEKSGRGEGRTLEIITPHPRKRAKFLFWSLGNGKRKKRKSKKTGDSRFTRRSQRSEGGREGKNLLAR